MVKGNGKTTKAVKAGGGPTGFVFFMAWIGALVYFIQVSYGFWGTILAVLKSFVWPAYVLHAVLGLLHVN